MKRADRRAFRIAFAAWLFGVFAYFVPAATWNPVSRFNLTRAIVERGSLTVDPYASSTGDRARVGDHWYSDKAPVVAVMAVPAYAGLRVIQSLRGVSPDYRAFSTPALPAVRVIPNQAYQQALYICSLFTTGVAGVVLGLLTLELLRRRTTLRAAFVGTTVIMLGTPVLPYATSFYGHVPAAALIVGALFCLDRRGTRAGILPSSWRLRLAGLCLGLAVGCEYLTAVPGAVIGIWYLVVTARGERWKAALQIALGGALPAIALAAYHTAAFGAPWRTGYSFETQAEFVAGHATGFMGIHLPRLEGLLGIAVSTRRGLFYLSPVAVVGLVLAVRLLLRRRDFVFQAGLAVLGVLWLLNSGYYMWWGGASAGPRHLVPGMMFLAIGVAVAWRSRRRWLRILTLGLALISVANCLAISLVGLEAPETGDLLRDFVWKRMRDGRIASLSGASNLGLKLGLSRIGSVIPILGWVIIGFAYLYVQARRAASRKLLSPVRLSSSRGRVAVQ